MLTAYDTVSSPYFLICKEHLKKKVHIKPSAEKIIQSGIRYSHLLNDVVC